MATAAKHSFVDFEFDAEVLALWQSITTESIKTFAYQKKLRALINEAQIPWQTNLDSLKVLDALLSVIKSDFNQKNIQESQALAHKEFIKLLAVLALHTVKVLEQELSSVFVRWQDKTLCCPRFWTLVCSRSDPYRCSSFDFR